ncbi:hypothetical protein K3495_g7711 [Podosphaera aphanis]|nr:hypothetical protein K3495_g7711 [Podosphaera aphanis]
MGALYVPNSDTVQLTKLNGSPLLSPISKQEMDSKNVTTWATTNILTATKFTPDASPVPKELVTRKPPEVSANDKLKINQSVHFIKFKFPKLFHTTQFTGSATRATGIKHDIILNDNSNGLKSAPGRYSPQDTKIIRKFIDSGLQEGILYRGQSPYSSRAILVPKDGKPKGRMVIDFRQINAHTEKSAYPLPIVQDEIRKAAGHRFYVKFDLKSGFNQIELTERAQKICSFVTPQGQYLFRVMPFGLTNAPATFQKAMDECLEPIREITANMIDDVITWGDTIQEATSNATLVLERLQTCGYRLNPRKCAWFVTQTRFLGHIIDRDGIQVDPLKIRAILDRPMPRTVTELAGPLYSLTALEGKNVPVSLNDEQISAWKATRNALITTPVLRPMDSQLPVVRIAFLV